jgi:hypothetical protein
MTITTLEPPLQTSPPTVPSAAAAAAVAALGGTPTLSEDLDEPQRLKSLLIAQEAWEQEKQRLVDLTGAEELAAARLAACVGPRMAAHGPWTQTWWSIQRDYARLGLLENEKWHITDWNHDYALCPTYPSALVLPTALDRESIASAASFRSKLRLPALVWIHPENAAPLCRSAQPRTGMAGNSNAADVALLNAIRETVAGRSPSTTAGASGQDVLMIFDARARLNAMANMVLKGKGTERVAHYGEDAAALIFLDIGNIHVVRASLNGVVKACTQAGVDDAYPGVGASSWIGHLSSICKGAAAVAAALEAGNPALVHCSDGWDRTSQLTSLAQLLLDPYYRTIEGFCVLIAKEWCSFGHMFDKRCGEYEKSFEKDDSSPVFVQWLDVVHQIQRQFGEEFEFDETLLLVLVDVVYSNWFGTFLFGSEMKRVVAELDDATVSVWDYVVAHVDRFKNPLYNPTGTLKTQTGRAVQLLVPKTNQCDLVLWNRLFRSHLRHDTALRTQATRANDLATRIRELEAELAQSERVRQLEAQLVQVSTSEVQVASAAVAATAASAPSSPTQHTTLAASHQPHTTMAQLFQPRALSPPPPGMPTAEATHPSPTSPLPGLMDPPAVLASSSGQRRQWDQDARPSPLVQTSEPPNHHPTRARWQTPVSDYLQLDTGTENEPTRVENVSESHSPAPTIGLQGEVVVVVD